MSGRWCWCTDGFREGKLTPTNIDMLECSRLHPAIHAQDPTPDAGPALPRQHPALLSGAAARDHERRPAPAWRALTGRGAAAARDASPTQVGIAVERARLAEESTRLARAEERTRIAREIHDTLAQGLTAIGLDIEGALRHLESSPERPASGWSAPWPPPARAWRRRAARCSICGPRRWLAGRWPRRWPRSGGRSPPRPACRCTSQADGRPRGLLAAGRGRAVPDRPGGAGERPPARPRHRGRDVAALDAARACCSRSATTASASTTRLIRRRARATGRRTHGRIAGTGEGAAG